VQLGNPTNPDPDGCHAADNKKHGNQHRGKNLGTSRVALPAAQLFLVALDSWLLLSAVHPLTYLECKLTEGRYSNYENEEPDKV
jgi:hypothetical protein